MSGVERNDGTPRLGVRCERDDGPTPARVVSVAAFVVLSACAAAAAAPVEPGRILFLGDSLTAGYGVPPGSAFPELIAERISEHGWEFQVVNAGIPGDTSAGGLSRIDWLLRSPVDVLVLELGANDALRGLPLDRTAANLQGIIDRTREKYPEARIVIAGMLAPPNLGPRYTGRFRDIFPELAEANDAELIPFLLEDVAARPGLNLPDGIHPNPEGHRIVAATVWRYLEPILEEARAGSSDSGARADSSRVGQPPAVRRPADDRQGLSGHRGQPRHP